ncbi:MAG TPA: hypothetical protein PKM27_07710 [Saprospiraceae bacterium]|nr:hypothetical protein [Saprospiraceae bacterium]HNT20244.1 hypothetical protein [Saprospiraceae bacterium]
MNRLSSGWTLVLRLFVPVFYVVFMGALTLATLSQGADLSPVFGTWIYRLAMPGLVLAGILTLRFTVWKLLRLDASPDHFYITNYFRTYRYSLDSIESIRPFGLFFLKFIKIKLKEKGSLGKELYILVERELWDQYADAHPQVKALMQSPG